jgi:hypothetical protein
MRRVLLLVPVLAGARRARNEILQVDVRHPGTKLTVLRSWIPGIRTRIVPSEISGGNASR